MSCALTRSKLASVPPADVMPVPSFDVADSNDAVSAAALSMPLCMLLDFPCMTSAWRRCRLLTASDLTTQHILSRVLYAGGPPSFSLVPDGISGQSQKMRKKDRPRARARSLNTLTSLQSPVHERPYIGRPRGSTHGSNMPKTGWISGPICPPLR